MTTEIVREFSKVERWYGVEGKEDVLACHVTMNGHKYRLLLSDERRGNPTLFVCVGTLEEFCLSRAGYEEAHLRVEEEYASVVVENGGLFAIRYRWFQIHPHERLSIRGVYAIYGNLVDTAEVYRDFLSMARMGGIALARLVPVLGREVH